MFTKKGILLAAIALLAISANAEKRTITPQVPTLVNGCYQISNAEELYGFAELLNVQYYDERKYFHGCVELTADIVVNEGVFKNGVLNVADTANFVFWEPIQRFLGTFDGKGHSILGLFNNDEESGVMGLFEDLYGDSFRDTVIIRDLHIKDVFFNSENLVGAIAGYVDKTTLIISNCSVDGVVMGESEVGGFVGNGDDDNAILRISNSYNKASVSGHSYVGGLVGYAKGAELINVYNAGSVSGKVGKSIGGIIGEKNDDLYLYNVFNVGSVTALDSVSTVGAIVGSCGFFCGEEYLHYDNVMYLASDVDHDWGVPVSEESFRNGAVAMVLHDYLGYAKNLGLSVDGSIWGQNVGVDAYPNFSGSIDGELSFDAITLSLDTGSAVLWTKQIPRGLRYKLPNVEREYYALLGWYDNAELSGDSVTHVLETQTTDVKYWGYYKRKYKVTLEMEDATVHPYDQVNSYVYTIGAKLPTFVSRKGYVFAGWYENEDLSGKPVANISATATGDKTFYAKWLKIKTPTKESDGCYAISDAAELYGFAAIVNGTNGKAKEKAACGKLTKDIVVNENVLNSDGSLNMADTAGFMQWNPLDSFAGIFDGNMHTISGLYAKEDISTYSYDRGIGFIGTAYGTGDDPIVIKNVGIIGSYFNSLVSDVGGIIGKVLDNKPDYLITHIQNSYNASTVAGYVSYVGGIVGSVDGTLDVDNCYNLGLLLGDTEYDYLVGGIVGKVYYSAAAYISDSYSAGKIVANRWTPIVAGKVQIGNAIYIKVTNSYYLDSLASQTVGDSLGIPVTADQLKNGTVALLLHDGEKGSIWGQNVGVDDHPVLSGEIKNADGVKKSVTFHTIESDTNKYYDFYIPGFYKVLPYKSEVTAPHMDFLGWYDNAKFNGDVIYGISEDATGDLDIYAKWEPHLYKVLTIGLRVDQTTYMTYYTPVGTVEGVDESKGYKYGEKITLKAVTEAGHCFDYWEDDTENHNPVRTVMVASDTLFRAFFVKSDSACPEYSSSSESSSSSSEPASSSSVKSSSSVSPTLSSSSESPKSSSSSVSPKSSSSDKSKSSSSSKKGDKDGLMTIAQALQFSVEVVGRDIRVSGVFDARSYALLDMQGRVLRRGPVTGVSFAIPVNRAGTYFVRVGNGMQRVSVK